MFMTFIGKSICGLFTFLCQYAVVYGNKCRGKPGAHKCENDSWYCKGYYIGIAFIAYTIKVRQDNLLKKPKNFDMIVIMANTMAIFFFIISSTLVILLF